MTLIIIFKFFYILYPSLAYLYIYIHLSFIQMLRLLYCISNQIALSSIINISLLCLNILDLSVWAEEVNISFYYFYNNLPLQGTKTQI
jgi:hypothetical protein